MAYHDERGPDGLLTDMALAMSALSDYGCDCGTDEPGSCMACLCERALRTERAEVARLRDALADDLRSDGWMVAVHNDYSLAGERHTFWLLTKNGRAIKGEGRTDSEALNIIRAELRGEEE